MQQEATPQYYLNNISGSNASLMKVLNLILNYRDGELISPELEYLINDFHSILSSQQDWIVRLERFIYNLERKKNTETPTIRKTL